jgi:hypothetical protein
VHEPYLSNYLENHNRTTQSEKYISTLSTPSKKRPEDQIKELGSCPRSPAAQNYFYLNILYKIDYLFWVYLYMCIYYYYYLTSSAEAQVV